MGNSESRSPNDQVPPSTSSPYEDGCKEAEIKLIECAITLPEVRELATKALTEAFKAAAFHDEDKYMKGGACKESFTSLAECPDRDKLDMQMAMLNCMEDHSDYYHKYLEIVDEQMSKKAVKELESIFPGEEKEWALEVHKYFMKGKGGCCKEQYTGYTDCMIEKLCEEEQCGPFVTTITKMLFRKLGQHEKKGIVVKGRGATGMETRDIDRYNKRGTYTLRSTQFY
ncbi:hypothetical protein Bca52824_022560 [Brassica carinata]|uniref:GCK domain-containing protein n=1 Tax=Brassica carinata TaxID=52824 RepID=A0A8X8ATH4_BRACI|nr:hypothetical protein Bca52824_022560 [Brassica carinata]